MRLYDVERFDVEFLSLILKLQGDGTVKPKN
jgi:hypothetical protein